MPHKANSPDPPMDRWWAQGTTRRSPVGLVRVATGGGDPGAGVEPDAVVAQVLGERVAQTRFGTRCGAGVQPLQYLAGAGEAADPVGGCGDVWTVVDRLMDVSEGHVAESCSLEDLANGLRISERERIWSSGWDGRRPLGCSEGLADNDIPLVALVALPDHHHQAPARA